MNRLSKWYHESMWEVWVFNHRPFKKYFLFRWCKWLTSRGVGPV